MRITFLGTGTSQGVPVIGCTCQVCLSSDPRDNRLRTSAMVEVDGQTIIIDTGPDFRQQMLRHTPVSMPKVIFTHEHKDHIAGLDDIRAFNFKYNQPLEIYATDSVQEALQREYHYVFAAQKYPGVPQVNLHTISGSEPFEIEGVRIIPIQLLHYKMPVLGFRIKNFAYVTDANYISSEEKIKLRDLDVLVLNALRKKEHISHFNLREAVNMVKELKPRKAYFTHISHLMGNHAEVQADLPENIFLASDGLTLDLE